MPEPIVIVGAGGFGRETIDLIRAINAADDKPKWSILGVVDDAPSQENLRFLANLDVAVLGPVEAVNDLNTRCAAIAVSTPAARRKIACQLEPYGCEFPSLLHPTAVIGGSVSRGHGLIACAHVSVGVGSSVGDHVHLNPHAVIGHDATLSDLVSVNPNATVSGNCPIGEGALIGAGAVVLQGVKVGDHARVGAGACVVKNVPRGTVVKGVPAR